MPCPRRRPLDPAGHRRAARRPTPVRRPPGRRRGNRSERPNPAPAPARAKRAVVARPYSERPPRFVYELSAAGQELAGALRLIAGWGARNAEGATAPRHVVCDTPDGGALVVPDVRARRRGRRGRAPVRRDWRIRRRRGHAPRGDPSGQEPWTLNAAVSDRGECAAMLRLIGIVVSIGLADSLNPTTIAPALYMATGERGRERVAEFTLAVFARLLRGRRGDRGGRRRG